MVLFAALLATAMDIASLQKMAARIAPVEVTADLSGLAPQERAALAKIVEAARLMDTLYLRQVWAGNHPLLLDLSQDATPLGRARLHLFLLYKGPWSSLDDDAPFKRKDLETEPFHDQAPEPLGGPQHDHDGHGAEHEEIKRAEVVRIQCGRLLQVGSRAQKVILPD